LLGAREPAVLSRWRLFDVIRLSKGGAATDGIDTQADLANQQGRKNGVGRRLFRSGWEAAYQDVQDEKRGRCLAGQRASRSSAGQSYPGERQHHGREAGELWIAQGETDGLEASTLRQYRQHLDFHLKPFIGAVKLAELAPGGVQNLRNLLISEKRSRVMAKKVVASLGAILATAMAEGKVARNVVREQARQSRRQSRLDKRHERRLEVGVDIPTKDEIRVMLAHAQGRWRPLVVTAVFTGLRASELRGLRWDDVDLEREALQVRQRADRWNTIGSPKSDAG
jgi:integrase